MAFSVLSSSMGDCEVNISLVDPTVLVSNTENLLVKQGVGFTIDWPENPSVFSNSLAFLAFLTISLMSIAAAMASAKRPLMSTSGRRVNQILCCQGFGQVCERWLWSLQL